MSVEATTTQQVTLRHIVKNVDLNVCGGYDNTTGNVTLYCKNVDLNVCGGYDNTTGNVISSERHTYL